MKNYFFLALFCCFGGVQKLLMDIAGHVFCINSSRDDKAVMLALNCSVINGFSSLGKIPLFQMLQTKECQSSVTTEMFVHLIPHSL